MKLAFPPFDSFIKNYTTSSSRSRYRDSEILELEVLDRQIKAKVQGTHLYNVKIKYNKSKVIEASCNCKYDYEGYCKHIINVLVKADKLIKNDSAKGLSANEINKNSLKNKTISSAIKLKQKNNTLIVEDTHILKLNRAFFKQIPRKSNNQFNRYSIESAQMEINSFKAKLVSYYDYISREVEINQTDKDLLLSCSCQERSKNICSHIRFVLKEILSEKLLRLPFDEVERHKVFQEIAKEKGWTGVQEKSLDDLFTMNLHLNRVSIKPKFNILSLSNREKEKLKKNLLPEFKFPESKNTKKQELIVVESSEYTDELLFSLKEAPLAKSGKIKSPIKEVSLSNKIRATKEQDKLLFYSAFLNQDRYDLPEPEDVQYNDIIKNPNQLPFYLFNDEGNYKVTAQKLKPIEVQAINPETTILVKESKEFYVLTCETILDNKKLKSKSIKLKGDFFLSKKKLYFINNKAVINVFNFFKENKHEVFIHQSQFPSFKEEFLNQLENSIKIKYSFVKKAPAKMVKEKSLEKISKHLIYLSEVGDFILIRPTIRYADIEVPILSKQTIYTDAPDGTRYAIKRNEKKEAHFILTVQNQHPDFKDNPQTDFFYLHKQKFLDEGWFLDVFEEWQEKKYEILGFKELKNNPYNSNKMKVQTVVDSGIDWFDVHTKVSFGNQKVRLKDLQKSVVNKKRYVKLGDGSQGLLPEEWIDKFSHYFRSGEIKGDAIRTHKSNFQLIDDLFDEEVLSKEAKIELDNYKDKLANFQSIGKVKIPKKLKADLRQYQKEGLNWLNFLDEFGFGGCLADDMGLGKTVQVIAYFLSQHEKGNKDSNLVIIPTSLLFNWEKEIKKFAPHLKYKIHYGPNRKAQKLSFKDYHIIITTYGTLLSDIKMLKEYPFNIVVLDESQAIKNPNSKRYKAVRLLQARQRLVTTGTPVENNTFDLYSQLSFVMPGLLGSQKRFKDDYSTPIDKFQDADRAKELQQKVHPFILRRTKKQVAKELPEKTEMVINCEMNKAQRSVYDSYKSEFQNYLKGKSEEELHSSTLHVLQGLTKLRQICNSPALLSDQEYYGDQSAKLEELMVQINKLKGQHKILVFSQFVGMLELIRERLNAEKIKYAYLTGKTRKREREVESFQNDDEVRVFLISLKAGGTGLNLTEAEYVFIVDPWWNPAVENQAIDRAYRIGQKNNVVAIRLIVPNSIEEKIMELQQRKLKLVEELIHTDNNVLKKLSKKDLLGMV